MTRACLMPGCPHKNYRQPGFLIHRFPPNEIIKRIWVGKTGLEFDEQKLSNGGICSYHFSSPNYKSGDHRRPLFENAVPDCNLPTYNTEGIIFNYDSVCQLANQLLQYEKADSKNKSLESEKIELTKKLKTTENDSISATKKAKFFEEKLQRATEDFERKLKTADKKFQVKVNDAFQDIFTPSQIDLILNKRKYKRWGNEEMAKALAIYNISSSCYVYLREQLHFPLPSKRSVLSWSSRIHVFPGLINPVLSVMKDEFQTFTTLQRQAIICFDEVSVDSRVSLEEKHQIILGPCKNLMGVYVRGLFSPWKQLVYFDFDLRLTKDKINEIITALFEVGVNVVGIVSDMCTVNVRVWNELGIDIKNEIYSFPHPCTGEPVWVFADFIHLVKLLRNHFVDNPIKLGPDFNNVMISRKLIEDILRLQTHDLKVAFNLTQKHLDLNKRERMNVRPAFQLLSHSTAKAIEYLLGNKEASEFFELVNSFCDLMNTHTKEEHVNPFKCPFGMRFAEQLPLLERFLKNILDLRVQGGKRPGLKPFQKGFKLTIGSLKGLFAQMSKSPVSCKYIMTSHINQDFVESSFSAFRGVGRFNDLPLPSDAIFRIKALIISWNLRDPRTTTVHNENSVKYLSSQRLDIMMKSGSTKSPNNQNVEDTTNYEGLFEHIDPNIPIQIPSIDKMTPEDKSRLGGSEYLAGYIAKKLLTAYPDLKTISPKNEIGWVKVLSTHNLTSPSDFWMGVFLKFEQYFNAFHRSMYNYKINVNREANVLMRLSNYLSSKFVNIPKEAITFYVRVRTKIRIEAINKKILVVRQKRRAQAFINSMVAESQYVESTDRETEETNMEDESGDAFDFENENVNAEVTVEDEFHMALDESFSYNPNDFDVFEDYEVVEALEEDASDTEFIQ